MGVFKIYDESESPNGGLFKTYDVPESPNEGASSFLFIDPPCLLFLVILFHLFWIRQPQLLMSRPPHPRLFGPWVGVGLRTTHT